MEVILKGKKPAVTCTPMLTTTAPRQAAEKAWSKPPLGCMKLSVDGSFKLEDVTAGCGMVLRDAEGNIVFSACRFLPRCVDAAEAELSACREGLELALEKNLYRSSLKLIAPRS